jgi:SAM-dependent methyltransferase
MSKLINAISFLRKNGMAYSVKEFYYRLADYYTEKNLNVNTFTRESDDNPGIINPEAHEYGSVHYAHLSTVFNMIPFNKNETTLIDYGCGKGRALIAAAAFSYKKIIGVEISETIRYAEENFRRIKTRNTHNVVLEQCDAQTYEIPEEVNLIYFCNPFSGKILENVVDKIKESYLKNPRKMYIIYFNNNHFDEIVKDQTWITKYYERGFIPYFVCGFYETNP